MAAAVTKMIEQMVNSAVDKAVGQITDKMCLEIEKKMPDVAARLMLGIEKRVDTKAFTKNIQEQFVVAANTARTTIKPLIVSDNNAQATGSIPSTSISGVASETISIPESKVVTETLPEYNKLGGRRLTISKKRRHKKTVKRRRKCRS